MMLASLKSLRRFLLCSTLSTFGAAGAFAANAADVTAPPPAPVVPEAGLFDTSFRLSFLSDYVTRGVTGTEGRPAVQGYGEIRIFESFYAGLLVSNVSYPHSSGVGDPKVELDFMAGIRQQWGQFGLDVGGYYSVYPGQDSGYIDINSGEFYAMPSFAVTESFSVNGSFFWTPDWGGTGAVASYVSAGARYVLPFELGEGVAPYVSGEVGRQTVGKFAGFDIPDWTNWNVGVGVTYKNMTFDVKYTNSDLSRDECEMSQGARSWCGERVVVGLSFDFN